MSTDPNEFDFFDLDANRLDEEWVAQPKLYFQYAEKLAHARSRYDQAKASRDVAAAEVDREVRKHPGVYGIEKVTENVVEKAVVLDKKTQAAELEVLKRKHKVDVLQAVVDALDHRKKALESLVHLRLANYYSEPRGPKVVQESMQEVEMDRAFGSKKRQQS